MNSHEASHLDSMSERSIFLAALEKETPIDRRAYLDQACGGDTELRARVESLLKSHDDMGQFLEKPLHDTVLIRDNRPTGAGAPPAQPIIESYGPGSHIGPYKLLEKIGEGGMGAVYRVEQETPVRREAALKIIRPGLDTEQVIARFEVERQALALMDHSRIARVLDAGTTDNGLPYFVMELVQGVPITTYCDAQRLTVRERLELFVPVCHAIQHAHQKGIIHRDIKPPNVLVTVQDGQPAPKVIDFGVAKALNQSLGQRHIHTEVGMFVGTLGYMSPEQADWKTAADVDTRSDIYALGVLLYQLLTGTTPLGQKLNSEAGFLETLMRIREEEPTRPSTQIAHSGPGLADLAFRFRTDPRHLVSEIRFELDWIVMKCLEKDRDRRYETVDALLRDIERYLRNEPVEACPPSRSYRLGKFVSRHKKVLLTAASFIVVLITGTAVSIGEAVQANRAEDKAIKELNRAVKAEGQAKTDRDRAIEAEKKAKGDRDRAIEAEKKAKMEEERAIAAEKKAKEDRDRALAEKKRADEQAENASAVSGFLQHLLMQAAPDQNPAASKVTVEDVVRRAEKDIGARFQGKPVIEASIRQALGETFLALADYPAARTHLEKALDLRLRNLGEEHIDTLHSMGILGGLYQNRSQWYEKAEILYNQGLEISSRVLGPEHPYTLTFLSDLALLLHHQGIKSKDQAKLAKAEEAYDKVLTIRRRTRGKEHSETLSVMINLGLLYMDQKRYDDAERLWTEVLTNARSRLGEGNRLYYTTLGDLAELTTPRGQLARAEEMYVKTVAIRARVQGKDHPHTLHVVHQLGKLYVEQGKLDKAEPLLLSAYEGWLAREKILPGYRVRITEALELLVRTYQTLGREEEAQKWRARLKEFQQKK